MEKIWPGKITCKNLGFHLIYFNFMADLIIASTPNCISSFVINSLNATRDGKTYFNHVKVIVAK